MQDAYTNYYKTEKLLPNADLGFYAAADGLLHKTAGDGTCRHDQIDGYLVS